MLYRLPPREITCQSSLCKAEKALVDRLSAACDSLYEKSQDLTEKLAAIPKQTEEAANYMSSIILPAMECLRSDADTLEQLTDKSYWPYPTYSDILFY